VPKGTKQQIQDNYNDLVQQLSPLAVQERVNQAARRLVCVIAHVDHGKTTLSDSLLSAAHMLNASKAGTARALDKDQEEQERGITIKSTGILLNYPDVIARNCIKGDATVPLSVSLIDCPGHVDFSGEVTAALRICDGALVVVDCIEGIGVQTQTVLRQALAERVQPVLFLNKVDRVIGELQLTPEEAFQRLQGTIHQVNEIIDMYQPEDCDFAVSPSNGTVGFGSGLYGWGFTLQSFARQLVAEKNQVDVSLVDADDPLVTKVCTMLWGDYRVDLSTNKWKKGGASTVGFPRTFCQVVLEPIFQVHSITVTEDKTAMEEFCAKVGFKLKPNVWEKCSVKDIRKKVLKHWLPVENAMLTLINHHLPSPLEAQVHRMTNIYTGPDDDDVCKAMQAADIGPCDASVEDTTPAVVYITKMVPLPSTSKSLLAFGRVFSGSVRVGTKLFVLDPDYSPPRDVGDVISIDDDGADAADATVKHSHKTPPSAVVKGVYVLMADKPESVDVAYAGTTVALGGLDKLIVKTATLSSTTDCYPLKTLKFSVSPVVRVSIRAAKDGYNTKLINAMMALKQTDPCVQCYVDKSGEKILAGVGELHVEVCIHSLQDTIGCDIVSEEPSVEYRETVTLEGPRCMAKTRNKHNRLIVTAEPLSEDVVRVLEAGDVTPSQDVVKRSQVLAAVGFDRNRARKIWSVHGINILVDETVGLDMSPMKDMINTVFQEVCEESVLTREPLRGVLFSIVDGRMHSDSVHRRGDQVMPMVRRVLYGAILTSGPKLLEPIFEVNIQAPQTALAAIRRVLKNRKGSIVEDNVSFGSPIHHVKAFLPVSESFGFVGDLMGASSGTAFPNVHFSHWSEVDADPLVPDDPIVRAIRTRKRLPKVQVPLASDLLDKA
jgi:elongation factor 2